MKSTVPQLTSALGFQVTRLSLLFRRRLMRALAQWDLTPEQWQVLAALAEQAPEPVSQNALVELTLKDRHSISRMLDRMERDGWVRRRPNPDDARTALVLATPKAEREVTRMREALSASFGPLYAQLEPPQLSAFQAAVAQLSDLLEREEDPWTP